MTSELQNLIDENQNYHWFGTTPYDWHVHNDLFKLMDMLNRLANSTGGKMEKIPYWVFKIPHPISKHYKINYGAPLDVDAELIANGDFAIPHNIKKTRKKGSKR